MEEIKIRYNKFELYNFVESMLDFALSALGDQDYAVQWIEEPGEAPMAFEECLDFDALSFALEEGKCLFFAFSEVYVGDPIKCANGKSYLILNDDYKAGDQDAYGVEVAVDCSQTEFCLGDFERLGYLLQKEEEQLIINSAVNGCGCCPGPGPSIRIVEDCYIFDHPMKEFVKSYIKNKP